MLRVWCKRQTRTEQTRYFPHGKRHWDLPTKEGGMHCVENEFAIGWLHCQVHTNQKHWHRGDRKLDEGEYTFGLKKGKRNSLVIGPGSSENGRVQKHLPGYVCK